MGRGTFTRAAYEHASTLYVPPSGPATRRAEQQAHNTGKLNELVDPAGYGVIRRSLLRFEEQPDGTQKLTIGCSMPIETRLDTTGSMGGNVDTAIKVLPELYGLSSAVLPGIDVHLATGIFGDVVDHFVLCRPQFEMEANKIVEQLTLMVPERGGGDATEDPHYGIFGGAYLVRAYANLIGLKRYDFTVSDAPVRPSLSERQLIRIFGEEVFDKAKANGFDIDANDLPSTKEVVADLFNQAHAFFLQVGKDRETQAVWTDIYGPERVVVLPSTELLPQVQATIIGLTEGTLSLDKVDDFLLLNNVTSAEASSIKRSVANIPIGAQVPLRQAIIDAGHEIPQAGEIFRDKPDYFGGTNLWPISRNEVTAVGAPITDVSGTDGPNWL